ncbi:WD40 domain-containing protein, partial [Tubulinosema ratisbonensis]
PSKLSNLKKETNLESEAKKDLKSLDILETRQQGCIEGVEDTTKLTQDEILKHVPLITAEKAFSLDLKNGPFSVKYLRNGRHLLLYNSKGYISSFDVKSLNINFERNFENEIYDSVYLHNELFFSTAQKKNVFIYNNQGVEVHCCRDNRNVFKLEFLSFHFLLVSLSKDRILRYQDTSTGKMIKEIFVKENFKCMTQNKSNGIIFTGNDKGTVSLWSPNSKEYLTKVLCSKGNITSLEVEKNGNYFFTSSGLFLNFFDIRNFYKPMHSLKMNRNVKNVGLSDTNLLAVNLGRKIEIYKNIFTNPEKYLIHSDDYLINDLKFCPYEDILTLGTQNGIKNLVVPGCGDPIFDALEESPFYTKTQRRELEIKKLLEKIPYTFIGQESLFNPQSKKIEESNKNFKRYFEKSKETPLERIFKKE